MKMHIEPTKFLKNNSSIVKYHIKEKLCRKFKDWDYGNKKKIKKDVAISKDNKNIEDP